MESIQLRDQGQMTESAADKIKTIKPDLAGGGGQHARQAALLRVSQVGCLGPKQCCAPQTQGRTPRWSQRKAIQPTLLRGISCFAQENGQKMGLVHLYDLFACW